MPNPADYKDARRQNDLVRSPTVRTPRKLSDAEKRETCALTDELHEYLQQDLSQLSRADTELALTRLAEIFTRMEQHRALLLGIPT